MIRTPLRPIRHPVPIAMRGYSAEEVRRLGEPALRALLLELAAEARAAQRLPLSRERARGLRARLALVARLAPAPLPG